MDNQLLLSLCIPTNGAVKWILPVIESIYAQNYDLSKFEVVITDNGKNSELPQHIAKLSYSNLRYIQTHDEGFLNLVSSLKYGRGLFCKMINHRSLLLQDSISNLVELIERYKDSKPQIYCSNALLENKNEYIECPTTDDFVKEMSYFCSWSAGIGFWQDDIKKIDGVSLNKMFPNMSLLFELSGNDNYVIWNRKYQNMGDETGKGGYDLFYTFGVIFLDFLNDIRIKDRISSKTFGLVKRDLYHFLLNQYVTEVILPTKMTFIIKDVAQSMNIYYGKCYYWWMVIRGWIHAPVVVVKRFLKII